MMRRRVLKSLLSIVAAFCALAASAEARDKLRVVVSIPPQAYFVERVGGERVEVEVLVDAGQSPHTYEPTARQMVRLCDADVYFRMGVEFENAFVPRVERMCDDLRIVDLRDGVPLRRMKPQHECDQDHDQDSEHGESRPDPHTWLDPKIVMIQAKTIADTLSTLDAAHADVYRENLAAFQADLDRVHTEIAEVLAPLRGQKVFVFHPAFGYFTDAFGLEQVPVEVEGKQPTARQLVRLIEQAKSEGVRVIFVQRQFSKKSARVIADAIDGAVVPIDPLARDYLKNLREMAEEIRAAIPPSPAATETNAPGETAR